jgi:hypothetical protein
MKINGRESPVVDFGDGTIQATSIAFECRLPILNHIYLKTPMISDAGAWATMCPVHGEREDYSLLNRRGLVHGRAGAENERLPKASWCIQSAKKAFDRDYRKQMKRVGYAGKFRACCTA